MLQRESSAPLGGEESQFLSCPAEREFQVRYFLVLRARVPQEGSARAALAQALLRLSKYGLGSQQRTAALAQLERLRRSDPLREHAHPCGEAKEYVLATLISSPSGAALLLTE